MVAGAPLPVDGDELCMAADVGHLEVFRWAREQHCPWDEETCRRAAAGGYLKVLQWARELTRCFRSAAFEAPSHRPR